MSSRLCCTATMRRGNSDKVSGSRPCVPAVMPVTVQAHTSSGIPPSAADAVMEGMARSGSSTSVPFWVSTPPLTVASIAKVERIKTHHVRQEEKHQTGLTTDPHHIDSAFPLSWRCPVGSSHWYLADSARRQIPGCDRAGRLETWRPPSWRSWSGRRSNYPGPGPVGATEKK